MPESRKLLGFRRFAFMEDVAVRTGVYTGVSLSFIFIAWLFASNRVPFLEPFVVQRKLIAGALLFFFACVPIVRFFRSPAELLVSGLLGWSLLTLTYRIFCFKFVLLEQYYSAFHVFVLGSVCYLILATLSWIGTIIWRVHATDHSHTHH